ncbi:MAG: hypothetical protein FJ270_08070 [Planctomycetes bacterium]|nr:hypothetical protein [Planctomycetota bacterium]
MGSKPHPKGHGRGDDTLMAHGFDAAFDAVAFDGTSAPDMPPMSVPTAGSEFFTPGGVRNRIVVLGRRGSGKTVFITRLYEALWQGCRLVNGRFVPERQVHAGDAVRTLSARARDGRQHTELRRMAMDLDAGKWPVSTQSSALIEIDITLDGRTKLLSAMDYPGEVFRTAFAVGAQDPASNELRDAVDCAAVLILLVDPAVALKPGIEREEDSFGLVAAVERLRSMPNGDDVPVVVVLTKCDVHVPLLRAEGGPRALAERLYPQIFRQLGGKRTVVFASSATSVVRSPRGMVIPRKRRAPRDVVEPLVFCLDWLERAEEQESLERAQVEASRRRSEQLHEEQAEDEREERKARVALVTFWIGVSALLVGAAVVTLWWMGKL